MSETDTKLQLIEEKLDVLLNKLNNIHVNLEEQTKQLEQSNAKLKVTLSSIKAANQAMEDELFEKIVLKSDESGNV